MSMTFFEEGVVTAYEKEPSEALNIISLLLLKSPIERSRLESLLIQRALQFKRLRSAIVKDKSGFHSFADVSSNGQDGSVFRSIIFEKTLERGGMDEVEAYMESIFFNKWRDGLPHWEVHLIHNARISDTISTAIVFRIDHALGDGAALLHALMSLTDPADPAADDGGPPPGAAAPTPNPPPPPPRPATALEAIGHKCAYLFWQVVLFLPALWFSVVLSEFRDTLTAVKWDPAAHPRSTRKRLTAAAEAPLDRLRAVARRRGATVNDVFLAVVAGALRRYLTRPGGDPAVAGRPGEPRRVTAICPASIRPAAGLETDSDGLPGGMVNRLTFIPISLPVAAADFDARVRDVGACTRFLKASPAPWLIYRLQQALYHVAGRAAMQAKLHAVQNNKTLAVSNLAGPRTKVMFCGSLVQRMIYWVNPSTLATTFTIMSYGGSAVLGMLADPGVVKDPAGLASCLAAELADVVRAA